MVIDCRRRFGGKSFAVSKDLAGNSLQLEKDSAGSFRGLYVFVSLIDATNRSTKPQAT